MLKVLVVDDDRDLRSSVASALSERNYVVHQAENGEEAINRVTASNYDMVILDVNMPKVSGIEALKEIKEYDPSILVIILTAFSNIRDAVEATKQGAYNYLEKPIKAENLVYMVDKALKAQNMVRSLSYSAPVFRLPNGTDFIGQSSEMKKVFGVIDRLSQVNTAVLIRGESGTGKELVAQALHFNGPKKENRFVTVNCSAIPENLIESEFFGHEKGAFTGADSRKIGKFQYADGGTLFLDEIGDISAGMQVKLLRVLQEKKFTPVGSNREVEVDVRIVAATNRHLEEMIKKDEFREDLFYRLNVLPIQLPPLRERKNDIAVLVNYFIEKFNQQYSKRVHGVSDEVGELLRSHRWPGNIRELENVMEHAFVIETTDEISAESLPSNFKKNTVQPQTETTAESNIVSKYQADGLKLNLDELDFKASKELFERQFLVTALKTYHGKINQTAIHANIPKKTLLRKLEKYGINAKDYA
jgi:DNA-binding NtrC family response regulator